MGFERASTLDDEEVGAGTARAVDAEATSKLEVTKVALLSFIVDLSGMRVVVLAASLV